MTVFDDMHKTTVIPSINATHGQTVTYNPLAVAGSTITAVFVEEQEDISENSGDGKTNTRHARFTASPDDITSADERDTITFAGDVWAVEMIVRRKPVVEYKLIRREEKRIGGHIDMGR